MQIIVNRSEITVKLDAEDFFKALDKSLEEYLEADIAEEFDDEDDLLEEL